ncbi:MAG: isoleucine--tRNA ligase [Spirochaetaceae bacterium]
MYTPVDPKVSFPEMETRVLDFWERESIFEKSLAAREGAEEFVFYDGPPFATGLPHFGHFVPGTIKDVIPRYQTMKGRHVERRFGWDCHGLPVEYEMEKELGISGKYEIESYGVAQFNEQCRSIVLRFTGEWERIVTRLGRWVDFKNDYKTMDPDYMESIWWVFHRLWEQGLVYEGYYILPYSPKLATPLSNFEVNLGGYREVTDPAVTVRFEAIDEPDTYFLAWTTTPWTLPSNLGLAVGPDITYVKVKDGDDHYILAETLLSRFYRDETEYTIVKRMQGSELAGRAYKPVMPYFSDLASEGAFKVHAADFVTVDDGSGIVHIAPGFGEDDYNVLKHTALPIVLPIDDECRFTAEVPEYQGLFVKDADKAIIRRLKEEGKLVKRDNYVHSYPFCYRTGAPLIYRAVSSWFVDVEKIKNRMLDANSGIGWVPGHLRDGRFGKWLEGAREWAISRNRFWGNPIPVWKADGGDHIEVISSREELEKKVGRSVPDLHKHFVDELTWPAPEGQGTMRRVPQVLDCWFESGAMPYAQNHYPFENKEWFEKNFPAHFIAEGLDQTRGWFYTLTVLAAALFDKPAFQNVVVNGLVLAADGKKMSKSLRNYTDPMKIVNTYGADALRVSLMNSPVVRAEDLKFSDESVKDVLKGIIIPLWNAYSFFVTYANIDNARPTSAPDDPVNPLDRWILSEAETLSGLVAAALDSYELQRACEPIVSFIDLLNNWYIRRSRRRFWRSENDADKLQAYETLFSVLMTLVKVAAPIVPFITEDIYRNLRSEHDPESVHLCDYPVPNEARRDSELEKKMATTRTAVSLGRALRSMHNLKNRQPLRAIHLVTRNAEEKRILREMEEIIRDEINVKDVLFRDNEEDLVDYRAKPNFRVLGPVLGKKIKAASAAIEQLSGSEIHSLLEGTVLHLDIEGERLELDAGKVEVQRLERENLKVLNEGSLTVALDSEITEELRREGIIRDLIRAVQNLRKSRGLDVTDRIRVRIAAPEDVLPAVEDFRDYFMNETLTTEVSIEEAIEGGDTALCGDSSVNLALEKSQ